MHLWTSACSAASSSGGREWDGLATQGMQTDSRLKSGEETLPAIWSKPDVILLLIWDIHSLVLMATLRAAFPRLHAGASLASLDRQQPALQAPSRRTK